VDEPSSSFSHNLGQACIVAALNWVRLAANLCKYGTHVRILRAIMRTAEQMG